MIIYIAEIDTRHFSFLTAAKSEAGARSRLMAGWRRHCADYSTADPGYIKPGDVAVHALDIDAPVILRDGEPL